MKLKQAILSVMGRDALKGSVDALDLDGVDRRSVDDMRSLLSRAHRATAEVLLQCLSESEVKDVCDLVGIPPKGRRGSLVDALLESEASGPESDSEEEKPGKPGRGRAAAPEVKNEPTRWMRPEEAQMSEQATDKPEVARQREPGRPFEITRTELVWPGKYDEKGNLVEPPRVSLPFQVIEVIEEGRTSREGLLDAQMGLFGAKSKGPEEKGWRNKLIWGDNLLVEASLLKDFAGKIDLIYIDPPFAIGADFSFRAAIGETDVEVDKEPSAVEAKAYRDTWGRGYDSYLEMLFGRLVVIRQLLSDHGTIYVHVGPTVSHYVRCLLEGIFGSDRFVNEVVWRRAFAHNDPNRCGQIHDSILIFQNGDQRTWNTVYQKPSPDYIEQFFDQYDEGRKERYNRLPLDAPRHGDGGNLVYEWKGVWPAANRTWANVKEKMQEFDRAGRIHYPKSGGMPRLKRYESEYEGAVLQDIWTDINKIHNQSSELLGYNTQKPEALLDRIIRSSSNPGDLVADFFCGSGTTLAVAEKLGRRWIGADLGRFAIHTTRKRLLDLRVKDQDTGNERGCRPFEVLNLGRYERKYWQGVTFGNEPKSGEETALAAYVRFILDLYKTQPILGTHVHGKKGGAFVHVGAVDAPVTISQIEDASAEAERLGGKELHILGWEFEMGLHDPITQYVRAQHGVIVRLVSIPRETMERRAVETGDVQFFDLAFLQVDVKPEKGGKKDRAIKVVLKDFVIPSTDLIPDDVRAKIKKWSDYIDYWAVDWDFRNDTFVSQWQTYRTRQDRSLALETPAHGYDRAGTYQILVKVVDIFGNDTSHLVRWEVK
jgi:DNA modification methylase